jgi:hypothetical protein
MRCPALCSHDRSADPASAPLCWCACPRVARAERHGADIFAGFLVGLAFLGRQRQRALERPVVAAACLLGSPLDITQAPGT